MLDVSPPRTRHPSTLSGAGRRTTPEGNRARRKFHSEVETIPDERDQSSRPILNMPARRQRQMSGRHEDTNFNCLFAPKSEAASQLSLLLRRRACMSGSMNLFLEHENGAATVSTASCAAAGGGCAEETSACS